MGLRGLISDSIDESVDHSGRLSVCPLAVSAVSPWFDFCRRWVVDTGIPDLTGSPAERDGERHRQARDTGMQEIQACKRYRQPRDTGRNACATGHGREGAKDGRRRHRSPDFLLDF